MPKMEDETWNEVGIQTDYDSSIEQVRTIVTYIERAPLI